MPKRTKRLTNPKTEADCVGAIATTQAISLMNTLVLNNLLTRYLLTQKNPSKVVRNMYDSITKKLDGTIELWTGEPEVVAEARKNIDELFFSLGKYFDRRQKR
jgi:hypothetical protein